MKEGQIIARAAVPFENACFGSPPRSRRELRLRIGRCLTGSAGTDGGLECHMAISAQAQHKIPQCTLTRQQGGQYQYAQGR